MLSLKMLAVMPATPEADPPRGTAARRITSCSVTVGAV